MHDFADAEKVTVLLDNLNVHTKGSFYTRFEPEYCRKILRRCEFVYTPVHGSWLQCCFLRKKELLMCRKRAGDLQSLISVKSDKLENFSGGIAKIFCGFDEGVAGVLEESQDAQSEIRQGSKDLAQADATQRMPVFVPPSVFDEVQRVLDLPMIANQFLKFRRLHIRRVNARDEVARVV